MEIADQIGSYPLIIRPAFTLGGSGGGIAYNVEEFQEIIESGLQASVTSQARSMMPHLSHAYSCGARPRCSCSCWHMQLHGLLQ